MTRLLGILMQTALLALIIIGLSFLPDAWQSPKIQGAVFVLMLIVGAGIAALLGFIGHYLWKHRRAFFFCMLFVFVGIGAAAQAQTMDDKFWEDIKTRTQTHDAGTLDKISSLKPTDAQPGTSQAQTGDDKYWPSITGRGAASHDRGMLDKLAQSSAPAATIPTASLASTQGSQLLNQITSEITQYGGQTCSARDQFDPRGKGEPDANTIIVAQAVLAKCDLLSANEQANVRDSCDCANGFIRKVEQWRQLNASSKIRTVRQILTEEQGSCWPCNLILLLITSIEKLTYYTETTIRNMALSVMLIGFLFWIVVKFTLWFTKKIGDGGTSFLQELMTRLIAVIMMAIFLQAPIADFFETVVSPFIGITMNLTNKIVAIADAGGSATLADQQQLAELKNCDNYCDAAKLEYVSRARTGGRTALSPGDAASVVFLDNAAKASLLCTSCKIYKQTSPWRAIGQSMVSYAWANRTGIALPLINFGIFPRPIGMFLLGAALVITFTILACFVAFDLIDLFLNLGFVVVLTPFWIAAFAFPISRQYTIHAWNLFLNTLVGLLGLAIGMGFLLALFNAIIPAGSDALIQAVLAPRTNNYTPNLYDIVSGNNTGSGFFIFMFVTAMAIFGIKVVRAGSKIVRDFAGVSGVYDGTASGAATGVAQGSGGLAQKGGKATMKITKKVIKG
ncbi:MAG: hypothetical protein PHX68_01810 [Alphaproteobacteria bacterium]|nr:hypothetical protein [Alphaproteobacteria bacterium]